MPVDPNNPYQKKAHRAPVATRTEAQRTIAVHCDDGSRRSADKTGKEGAFVEACRQVKVAVVPVLVPKSHQPERGRSQVEAIMGGMQLERDLTMKEFIGYEQSARNYAHRQVDECQCTMASRIAAQVTAG